MGLRAIQVPAELIADFDEFCHFGSKTGYEHNDEAAEKVLVSFPHFFPFEMFDNQRSFCCANSRANSSKQKPGWPQHTDGMIRNDLSSAWATEGHIFQLDFFILHKSFSWWDWDLCFRSYPFNFLFTLKVHHIYNHLLAWRIWTGDICHVVGFLLSDLRLHVSCCSYGCSKR